MALDNFGNFVRGNLTSAVSDTTNTFPVNNASIFPDTANGEYNLVCWDVDNNPRPDQDPDVEIVRVTGRDTTNDELTVTRAQENTTAVSHPNNSALHLSYTQKLASDIETNYVAEGEDFDGQSTSEFTNLVVVETDNQTINQSVTDPSGFTINSKLIRDNPVPTPTCYFGGPAHGEGGGAFMGAALAPDGRVILAPFGSSNVGIFDPSDNSYTSGPAHGEGGNAFMGAALAPDGRVIFAPFDSSNVGITAFNLDYAVGTGGNR